MLYFLLYASIFYMPLCFMLYFLFFRYVYTYFPLLCLSFFTYALYFCLFRCRDYMFYAFYALLFALCFDFNIFHYDLCYIFHFFVYLPIFTTPFLAPVYLCPIFLAFFSIYAYFAYFKALKLAPCPQEL